MANLRDPPRVAKTASSTSLGGLKPTTRSDIARNFAAREQLQSEVYLHVRYAMSRSNIISVLYTLHAGKIASRHPVATDHTEVGVL